MGLYASVNRESENNTAVALNTQLVVRDALAGHCQVSRRAAKFQHGNQGMWVLIAALLC